MELNEMLDKLVNEIKKDSRYLDYLEAEKNLYDPKVKALLDEYQNKLSEYEQIKKYEQYIDNSLIKAEIKEIKKQIASNQDINEYYQKYYCLNEFLEEITNIVFKDISPKLDISLYR